MKAENTEKKEALRKVEAEVAKVKNYFSKLSYDSHMYLQYIFF